MKITCENCVENEISMQVLFLAFSAAAAGAAFKRRVHTNTCTGTLIHWKLWEYQYTLSHTLHRYIF